MNSFLRNEQQLQFLLNADKPFGTKDGKTSKKRGICVKTAIGARGLGFEEGGADSVCSL